MKKDIPHTICLHCLYTKYEYGNISYVELMINVIYLMLKVSFINTEFQFKYSIRDSKITQEHLDGWLLFTVDMRIFIWLMLIVISLQAYQFYKPEYI